MSHNITACQFTEGNPFYLLQHLSCHIQTGNRILRQILLGGISRHDHLGSKADPCQKHLHLRRSRILRLIQNDKGIIERPTSHVG